MKARRPSTWQLAGAVAFIVWLVAPSSVSARFCAGGPRQSLGCGADVHCLGGICVRVLSLPLRWCAVEGSPAVMNPAGAGEATTDDVLWRRHERASDKYLIPVARLTLRSGFVAGIIASTNFPIISDPNPPPSGPGVLGDILRPSIDRAEGDKVVKACRDAWDALAKQFQKPLLGPLAINVRRLVDSSGNATASLAVGGGTSLATGTACAIPPANLSMAAGGYVIISDNQINSDDGVILAHEMGHVLRLGHGNGLDDDNSGTYDSFCDPAENETALPLTLMSPFCCNSPMSSLQINTMNAIAGVYSGSQVDPPGFLVNGDTVSDQRIDPSGDVTDTAVDVVWALMSDNAPNQVTVFTHGLFGTVPFGSNNQYLLFADLDNNRHTGGAPSDLGFSTGFQGAEIVTKVEIAVGGEFEVVIPTVWRYEGTAFVELSDPAIEAVHEMPLVDEEDGSPARYYSTVSIKFPTALRGPAGAAVRIQAIAQQLDGPEVDRLPDGEDDGEDILLVPPVFPVCRPSALRVQPGADAVAEANGLIPEQMAKVFLGDVMVGGGMTDANGDVAIPFVVPAGATGMRLLTVGVVNTAMTADCPIILEGGPLACGDGILGPGELCDDGNTLDGDCCSSACVPGVCYPIPAKVAIVKPAKLFKFLARGTFTLPNPGADNPMTEGGSLSFIGSTGERTYDLPTSCWRGLGGDGSKGFKCKDATCKVAVKEKVIKVVCKPDTGDFGPLPDGGPVDVTLSIGNGPTKYCARCGGAARGNEARIFKRKSCAMPAVCF